MSKNEMVERAKYREANIMIHWNNLISSFVYPLYVQDGREIYEKAIANQKDKVLRVKEK